MPALFHLRKFFPFLPTETEVTSQEAFDDPAWKAEMKKSGYPVLTYRGSADLDEFLAKTLKGLEKPLEIMVEERKKATK